MKEQRRIELIESAIRLFAQKGFHFTSVQDIVDDCNISKGAFYNYFPSKEALHIAIFQYYFEEVNIRLAEIDKLAVEPREKLLRQIRAPFEHTAEQKEFFVIYLREQSFSINKELQTFIEEIKMKSLGRYDKYLKEIYGVEIAPYLSDIILLMEGLTNSYLVAMLFHDMEVNIEQIPKFILRRVDEVVAAFYEGEPVVTTGTSTFPYIANGPFDEIDEIKKATAIFIEMVDLLDTLDMEEQRKTGLLSVIEFLKVELEKPELNKYIFQGMLANLKEIPSFDIYREKIANIMDVQLL